MAFIRMKRVNGKEYRQLVENYREDGKVRQRVLAHLGHHETVSEAAEYYVRFAEKQRELEAKVQEKLDALPARIEAHREYCRKRYKETGIEGFRTVANSEAGAPRFVEERRELEEKMAEHARAAARYETKASKLANLLASGKATPDSNEVRQKRYEDRQRQIKESQEIFEQGLRILRGA